MFSVKLDSDLQQSKVKTLRFSFVSFQYVLEKNGMKLTIRDLTMADKKNYTCVVSNELGEISYNFTVDVIRKCFAFNSSLFTCA